MDAGREQLASHSMAAFRTVLIGSFLSALPVGQSAFEMQLAIQRL